MAKKSAKTTLDDELTALASGDAKARKKSADALGRRGDPAAVPALISALDDGDVWVRMKAASALAAIGDPRAVEPLIARVTPTKGPKELQALVGALGNIPSERAAEALGAMIDAGLPAVVRWSVANALGAQGELGVAHALGYLDDPNLAPFACAALGRTRSLAAIDPLVGALGGKKRGMVREAAAEALGMIHEARAAEALAARLGDAEPGVRRKAALALHFMGARGGEAVAPYLSRGGVAATAAAYVLSMSGRVPEACGPALVALLTEGDAVTWAAVALEKTPGGVALASGRVGEWLTLVERGEGSRAAAAAWSLGWLASRAPEGFDDDAVARLVRALATRDGYVRARVCEAAAALAPRGFDAVRAMARGDDAAARRGAGEALAQRGEAEPELAEVFAESLADEGCAVWAAHALERIGPSARAAVAEAGARHGGEAAVRARRLLERWG